MTKLRVASCIIISFLLGMALEAVLAAGSFEADFFGLFLMMGGLALTVVTAVVHAFASRTKYAPVTLGAMLLVLFGTAGMIFQACS